MVPVIAIPAALKLVKNAVVLVEWAQLTPQVLVDLEEPDLKKFRLKPTEKKPTTLICIHKVDNQQMYKRRPLVVHIWIDEELNYAG